MPEEFTDKRKQAFEAEFKKMLRHYPNKQAAVLPSLRLFEKHFRYNDEDSCEYIAGLLGLSPAKIYGVLSFYTHYNSKHHGKYRIMVCMTLPCALMGAKSIVEYLKEKLEIDVGERTEDGKFSLEKVECLAACNKAPMMQINDHYYYHLTPEKIDQILEKLE
ncbi:MAG: hypothetical protein B6244_14180 [Candidatus Cloacimonetes bacterium 4572_55]|nr:MAG: hypothetical protein B6244_14180 [Candidatus Cloacimonetes bacterium 4572_55]